MKWNLPRWPAIAPPRTDVRLAPLWARLAWVGVIWLASVAALFLVALVLRWVLSA